MDVKVLSWNINGRSRQGSAEKRKEVVWSVVGPFEPDVLLLQEASNVLVDTICSNSDGWYKQCCKSARGANCVSDSCILYDSSKFNIAPVQPALVDYIELELIRDRVSMVCLEYRENSKKVIFVSFHNVKPLDKRNRLAAEMFCNMIEKMRKRTDIDVVAGADLNRHVRHPTITKYAQTTRNYDIIDHFILAPPEEDPKIEVVELDDLDSGYAFDHEPLLYIFDIR